MQVNLTFRKIEPTDGIKQHLRTRLDKVEKLVDRLVDAHIILSVEKGGRHVCEVTVHGPKVTFFAKDRSNDLYASIDLAMHALEKQLKKFKERLKSHKLYYKTKMARLAVARSLFDVERLSKERKA
ncbi:MAG: ribosome-associated translation inhibitor RaiA [Deltaproteobacteria bacterium]|nr:ribosome-associated translation inhibitor RaiA [Deltaproteobacteria bacterium]